MFPDICHDPTTCPCCGNVAKDLHNLDSFDLAFLILTEHVAFKDNFDTAFLILKEARKRAKWGPHATMLSFAFTKAWKREGVPLMRDLISCFDLSGDISVNRKKVERILGSKYFRNMGKRMWAHVEDDLGDVLDQLQMGSIRYFLKQYVSSTAKKAIGDTGVPAGGAFSLEDWNLYHQAAMQDHMQAFTTAYPERLLPTQVNQLVKHAETLPGARSIDKFNLNRRINAMSEIGEQYFTTLNDVEAGRLWSWTGVELAHQSGATEYQILSQRDKIVCPVCTRLDGKIFQVAATREHVNSVIQEMAPDMTLETIGSDAPFLADRLNTAFPFPRVPQIDNIPPSQLPKQGIIPPMHGRCRCDTVMLWTKATQSPMLSVPPDDIHVAVGWPHQLGDSLLDKTKASMVGWEKSKLHSEVRAWHAYKNGMETVYNPMAIMTQKSTGNVLGVAQLIEKKTIVTMHQFGTVGNMSQGNTTFMRAVAMYCKDQGKKLQVASWPEIDDYLLALGMKPKGPGLPFFFTKEQTAAWAASDPAFSGMSIVKMGKPPVATSIPTPKKPKDPFSLLPKKSADDIKVEQLLEKLEQQKPKAGINKIATRAALTEPNAFRLVLYDKKDDILGALAYKLKKDHIFVQTLGVLDEAPKGSGRSLMHRIFETAIKEKKGIRLQATAQSAGFYAKIGMTHYGNNVFASTLDEMQDILKGLKKSKAKPLPKPPAKKPTPKPKPVPDEDVLKPVAGADDWEEIPGTQFGSNPGGQYVGPDGKKYYVKFYEDANQIMSEASADEVAKMMGLKTLDAKVVTVKGKKAVATLWQDGGKQIGDLKYRLDLLGADQWDDITRQYLHASLTGNWDVVGMEYDNLVRFNKRWICVDHGGTFKFRAQGGGKIWGMDSIPEIDSLLAPSRHAGKIFNEVLPKTLEADPGKYIALLEKMPDEKKLRKVFEKIGWRKIDAHEMAETLLVRRRLLVEHLETFQAAAQAPTKRRVYKIKFKSDLHDAQYKVYMKKWEGMYDQAVKDAGKATAGKPTADQIRRAYRNLVREEVHKDKGLEELWETCSNWQGDSTRTPANALRLKAVQMEDSPLRMIWKSYHERTEIKEYMDRVISDKAYIEVRALNQAYFKKAKRRTMKLYRGTPGDAGRKYGKAVNKVREQFPDDWPERTVNVYESGLMGWTTREKTAKGFSSRFTVGDTKPVKEIFWWDKIWPKVDFHGETESLCIGFNGDPIKLKNIFASGLGGTPADL